MINIENATYAYPFQDRAAVENISLRVRPGEIVLCTGASGCGKSTLVRLANGLCPHYYRGSFSGSVAIAGTSTRNMSLAQLSRHVGTLFQDPEQQFFTLGVEEELVFALEWQGHDRQKMRSAVERSIKDFGIGPLLDSSLHTLSEGEKQKVGLAAICMQEPRALILDEPTANLDPEATAALAQKLKELRAAGMAILVVDHRLYWLENCVDRVLIMQDGRICEQGDFAMLKDTAVRELYGLRSAQVADVRASLPACGGGSHPVVEVDKLHFAHPGKEAIYDDASFSLDAGVTAFLGDNGAGKTTLARILAGLNTEQCGSITFAGVHVNRTERLKRCGIVLQNADHQLHMRTVRQELETCLLLAGSNDMSRVDKLLEDFAITDLADRHPQSLSGGQKQRLVIACSLAKNPSVLILDEPTSGLDGANMRRLSSLLQAQVGQDRCVGLITHDLELLGSADPKALRLPMP